MFIKYYLVGVTLLAQSLYQTAIAIPSCNQQPSAQEQNTIQPETSIHCGNTPTGAFDKHSVFWVVYEFQGYMYLSHSQDTGQTYSKPVKINTQAESIYTNGENRPKIAFGLNDEIYISWAQKTAGHYTGNIRFSRSTNGGKTFSTVKTINDDGLLIGHSFDSLLVDNKGDIYIVWLDKRDQVLTKEPGVDYAGTAIYYSFSIDKGNHFSKNRKIADNSCECCRIAISKNKKAGVAIFWRHIFDTNTRDHAFTTLLREKSKPIQRATYDDWQIDACPHHGPSMTLGNHAEYHTTWFSNGDDNKGIYYGSYQPNTQTMRNLKQITDAPSASHPFILAMHSHLLLAWKAFDGDRTTIRLITSENSGKSWSVPQVIADTQEASDHPLLLSNNKMAYLSWHTKQQGLRLLPILIQ